MRRLRALLRGPDPSSWSVDRVMLTQGVGVVLVHLTHLAVVAATGAPARVDVVVASLAVWVGISAWTWRRGPRLREAELLAIGCTGSVTATLNGLYAQPPTHVAFIAVGLLGVLLAVVTSAPDRVGRILLAVVLACQVWLQLGTFGLGATSLSVAAWTAFATFGACSLVVSAQRALERARLAAATSAETDHLTGLLNRRALGPRFSALRAACPPGHRAALVLLDLDHFKDVNDRHGHIAGDQVLVAVAGTMRRSSRQGDLLVRLGGEELAWVACWPTAAEARTAADRLRAAVAEAVTPGGVRVTASAGVAFSTEATHACGDEEALSRLLVRADAALYEAKRSGRDRVVLAAQLLPDGTDAHHGRYRPAPVSRATPDASVVRA